MIFRLPARRPIGCHASANCRCGVIDWESKMASEFEMNTLADIAVLKVAVDRILTHLARSSRDPRSFLAAELTQGLENLAKTNYWTVSHKNQKEILEGAKARYSELIGNIRLA
jgi:hypothetical protein